MKTAAYDMFRNIMQQYFWSVRKTIIKKTFARIVNLGEKLSPNTLTLSLYTLLTILVKSIIVIALLMMFCHSTTYRNSHKLLKMFWVVVYMLLYSFLAPNFVDRTWFRLIKRRKRGKMTSNIL